MSYSLICALHVAARTATHRTAKKGSKVGTMESNLVKRLMVRLFPLPTGATSGKARQERTFSGKAGQIRRLHSEPLTVHSRFTGRKPLQLLRSPRYDGIFTFAVGVALILFMCD